MAPNPNPGHNAKPKQVICDIAETHEMIHHRIEVGEFKVPPTPGPSCILPANPASPTIALAVGCP